MSEYKKVKKGNTEKYNKEENVIFRIRDTINNKFILDNNCNLYFNLNGDVLEFDEGYGNQSEPEEYEPAEMERREDLKLEVLARDGMSDDSIYI